MSRPTPYKRNKSAYADKIIKYKESPTGKAYIGISKAPLMAAADGGHGFQGVMIQDEDREFIQCHSCGEWWKKITSAHLKKCCGLTDPQYKEKYGLFDSKGLVSDMTSLRLTEACLKNKISRFKIGNSMGGRRRDYKKKPTAWENRYGICPEQLKARLIQFVKENHEFPSQYNRGRLIYRNIYNRYGRFGGALPVFGLPYFERRGTNMRYTFPDGSKYEYNINQFHSREALYRMIMKKCPVMKQTVELTADVV